VACPVRALFPLTEQATRFAAFRVARFAIGMQALHQLAVGRESHDAFAVAFILVELVHAPQLGPQLAVCLHGNARIIRRGLGGFGLGLVQPLKDKFFLELTDAL